MGQSEGIFMCLGIHLPAIAETSLIWEHCVFTFFMGNQGTRTNCDCNRQNVQIQYNNKEAITANKLFTTSNLWADYISKTGNTSPPSTEMPRARNIEVISLYLLSISSSSFLTTPRYCSFSCIDSSFYRKQEKVISYNGTKHMTINKKNCVSIRLVPQETFLCDSRTSCNLCFCLFSMSSNRWASAFFLFRNFFASSAWKNVFQQRTITSHVTDPNVPLAC